MAEKQSFARVQPEVSLKTYDVIKITSFTYRNLEIRLNGKQFVWAELKRYFFRSPILYIRTGSPRGLIVAAAKFRFFSSGIDLVTVDPVTASANNRVSINSLWHGAYSFSAVGTGRLYEWRKTHQEELGATWLSHGDLKLVEPTNSNLILAVHNRDIFFWSSGVAHIDFMVELGDKLELQAITSILAIQEQLRQQRSSNYGATRRA